MRPAGLALVTVAVGLVVSGVWLIMRAQNQRLATLEKKMQGLDPDKVHQSLDWVGASNSRSVVRTLHVGDGGLVLLDRNVHRNRTWRPARPSALVVLPRDHHRAGDGYAIIGPAYVASLLHYGGAGNYVAQRVVGLGEFEGALMFVPEHGRISLVSMGEGAGWLVDSAAPVPEDASSHLSDPKLTDTHAALSQALERLRR